MNKSHESYLVPFFKAMNIHFPEQWCVLHSYETLPFFSASDVDMAFSGDNIKSLEVVITEVAQENDWEVFQKFWYDLQSCYYYVLKQKETDIFLALDFLIDNQGIGAYGFKTTILTQGALQIKGLIPIPNHEVAFCYKLIKRIVKKRSLKEDKSYLLRHYNSADVKKIDSILVGNLGEQGKNTVINYITTEGAALGLNEIQGLNDILKRKKKKFSKSFNRKYWQFKRVIYRVLYPSGMIIQIPEMSEKELDLFINSLSNKVGLLFRFIKLNNSNSLIKSFKGFCGSTLVINPQINFNYKKAILYGWSKNKEVQFENNLKMNNIQEMVDLYYASILKTLLDRCRLEK